METHALGLPPILLLPGELLLVITSYLSIHEVLSVRQTCKQISRITRDRSIWIALLRRQQEALPLPLNLSQSHTNPLYIDVPTSEIESAVKSADVTARAWPRHRSKAAKPAQPKSGQTLFGLYIFLDKWLLSVFVNGLIHLWDLKPYEHPVSEHLTRSGSVARRASLNLGLKSWSSFAAAMDAAGECIIFAITHTSVPSATHIYRVRLNRTGSLSSPNIFEHLDTIQHTHRLIVRSIVPSLGLVILSGGGAVDLIQWSFNSKNTEHQLTRVPIVEEEAEGWNMILTVRIIGLNLLVFRSRSIDLFPLGPDLTISSDKISHRFTSHTFSEISCSQPLPPPPGSPNGECLNINFLGSGRIHGILRYNVCVRLQQTPGMRSPSLDVTCIGQYSLTTELNPDPIKSFLAVPPTSSMPSNLGPWSTVTSTLSRGFIVDMALGPQGRRAVWVERERGSTLREVVVWGKTQKGGDTEGAVMERNVVFSVRSYDLNDDIIHCALGEVSGVIVLGNRAGDIFCLKP